MTKYRWNINVAATHVHRDSRTALTQRLHVPIELSTACPSSPSQHSHRTTVAASSTRVLQVATDACHTERLPTNLTIPSLGSTTLVAPLVRCSPDVAQQAPNANTHHARSMRAVAAKWAQLLQTPQGSLLHDVASFDTATEWCYSGNFSTSCALFLLFAAWCGCRYLATGREYHESG